MEKVNVLKMYAFIKADSRERLTLAWGMVDGCKDVRGLRWAFKGRNIPMPVHSGAWFIGLKRDAMFNWLANVGYVYQGEVNMTTGSIWCAHPDDVQAIMELRNTEDETDSYYEQYMEQLGRAEMLEKENDEIREENRSMGDELMILRSIGTLSEYQLHEITDILLKANRHLLAVFLYSKVKRCNLHEAKDAVDMRMSSL